MSERLVVDADVVVGSMVTCWTSWRRGCARDVDYGPGHAEVKQGKKSMNEKAMLNFVCR